ncbi:MAG: glutamine-synthetase adenylyltransferase [Bdellovibrionota bacterium]
MIELPPLDSYSEVEIERLSWPAINRYRELLSRPPSVDSESTSKKFRIDRHREWLRCALATAFDRASAEDVCRHWSNTMDELVKRAWSLTGCDQHGYALLALGKLGARELNLSSDIDLIVVRSDSTPADSKPIKAFQNMLSEVTEFGFCARTDFTLRPGGSASALIPSMTELENYYGYHGETWERLAFVRMRVLAAPDPLRAEIENFGSKYSYRKHLDYTLIDELKHLRGKIRIEKAELRPGTFHLKLGAGGIRELELFVHAMQVLHGGRRIPLRTGSTSEAIRQIKVFNLLPDNDCDVLLDCYWTLRTVENRIQAYEDQQTYSVNLDKPAAALRPGDPTLVRDRCVKVDAITSTFFGPTAKENLFPESLELQKEWLTEHGFNEQSVTQTWDELLSATSLSRKSERDETARLKFLATFANKLAEVGLDRDLGLSMLLDFVKATRAKATFFTLLNRETRVSDELANLFSVSPYLGSILSMRPELIDEYIFRRQSTHSEDFDVLLEELAERRLLAELISSTQFLADFDLDKLNSNLSSNADAICTALLERLKKDHGPSDLELLALGKWGGRELGLRSDLDFVFVTKDAPTANDNKVAKRFISRLTEAHRGGAIYSIDTRLRPSGSSGPIIVTETQLKTYLETEAAAWERQAYQRARPLKTLTFNPSEVATLKGLSKTDVDELNSIRGKLFGVVKPGEIDLKLTDGGLADIEFTAQISLLAQSLYSLDPSTSGMIQYLEGINAAWKNIGPDLVAHYSFLRRVEQLHRLTASQSGSKMRVKSDEFKRIALVLKVDPESLAEKIGVTFSKVTALLTEVRSK